MIVLAMFSWAVMKDYILDSERRKDYEEIYNSRGRDDNY